MFGVVVLVANVDGGLIPYADIIPETHGDRNNKGEDISFRTKDASCRHVLSKGRRVPFMKLEFVKILCELFNALIRLLSSYTNFFYIIESDHCDLRATQPDVPC